MPKFSDYSSVTTSVGYTIPLFKTGTANKKISSADLFANIQDPVVINSTLLDNDTVIKGQTDAALFYVDASLNRVGVGTSTVSEKLSINGSLGFNGILVDKAINTQTTSGAVSISTSTTIVDSAATTNLQIGAGSVEGQIKKIFRKGSGSMSLVASGTTIVGGTTIVFSAVGSSVTLRFMGNAWYIEGAYNITIS